MKRYVAILMALCCLVGLAACGAGNGASGGNGAGTASYAISANDLVQTMRDAGYGVQPDGYETAGDLGITNAREFDALNFYKDENGVEKHTSVFFVVFADAGDAQSAYEQIVSAGAADGVYLRAYNHGNGKKATYTDDSDPYFGYMTIVSQVENTLVIAVESWDIDSFGTYDYELSSILAKLNY